MPKLPHERDQSRSGLCRDRTTNNSSLKLTDRDRIPMGSVKPEITVMGEEFATEAQPEKIPISNAKSGKI